MKRFREFIYNLHPYALCCISGPLTVAQIILAFVIRQPGSEVLRWIGWVLWWAGAVFGWLPIFTFRRRGGVAKGKSYVHTTRLVETGIYAIARHPQMGTAWLLMCVALMLITQHWISVALGVPAMALAYLDLLKADQRLIVKFGDAYRQYMERVPRVNFVAGIIRLIARRAGA
jgi:protein-S-isoprenylcysteine O-methyltransferase Ste14